MSIKNFLIVLMAGVIAGLLLFGNCNKPKPPAPIVVPGKVQVKEVVKYEEKFKKSFDSLKVQYANLEKNATSYKNKLAQEREKLKMKEDAMKQLNLSIEQKTIVDDYIEDHHKIDTTCERIVATLEKQIAVKDSLYSAGEILYSKVRASFDTCIKGQDQWKNYSKQLEGRLAVKTFGNKFWKGVAVVAGLVILKNSLK